MPRYDRSFVDEVLGRASILEVVGRRVMWDKRKSIPARGDMWACCPFHTEKSPSFHATESTGKYHCFGCGVHGNALDFVIAIDNVSFPEAVERLAADLAIPLPERDPDAEAKDDLLKRLDDALAAASAAYAQALRSPEGARARDYLTKRGLGEGDWARFGLGFAPNSRTWLRDRLTQGGHALADLVEAGLVKAPDDGSPPFDFYRGRVIFTIEDARGRVVSFGARTLDPDGQPKYLNGPDSPVFNKSRNLYRYVQARVAAKAKPIVVAEGYMDVIALERAGFAAVAPLGTALTEDQMGMIWKAAKRPILCFDGDKAGLNAASRALDRALPLVSADKTLAFGFLPEGQDPDDVIRAKGSAAFDTILADAMSLSAFLFQREQEREPLTSAEARAGLRKRLRAMTAQVVDPDLQREIAAETKARVDALLAPPPRPDFVPRGPYKRGGAAPTGPVGNATAELKLKAKSASNMPKAKLIDLVLPPLQAPALLDGHEELFASLPIENKGLDAIRHALLDLHQSDQEAATGLDFEAVRLHLQTSGDEEGVRVLDYVRARPRLTGLEALPDLAARRAIWVGKLQKFMGNASSRQEVAALTREFAGGDIGSMGRLTRQVRERTQEVTSVLRTDTQTDDVALLRDTIARHDLELAVGKSAGRLK